MKLIFLNGPPRSGKDTVASTLKYHYRNRIQLMKFASPIYGAIERLFGFEPAVWDSLYNTHKEKPTERLMGRSPRELMIWLSEEIIKPEFGTNFFGNVAARSILDMDEEDRESSIFVFSDSGFKDEINSCLDILNPSRDNAYLINLLREGCSFNGDSRSYITGADVGISDSRYFIVENEGTLFEFGQTILSVMNQILNEQEQRELAYG